MTMEHPQKCTGHPNITNIIDDVLQQLKSTFKIADTGKNPMLTRGDAATLAKKKRNTTPVPEPDAFGDVCHHDMVYDDGRAIGGIHHALIIVCRKTSHISIHCLQDLEPSTIRSAMMDFLMIIQRHPTKMIADRDFKLIGKNIKNLLKPNTQFTGAPSGRQSQNGE